MKHLSNNSHRSRAGFTLIEIMVVLVIAAILAAVTLGGYSAMRSSHARTSCQANMAQIYRAIRLYSSDYNGSAPFYNPDTGGGGNPYANHLNNLNKGAGIGLWALYGFANGADEIANVNIKPEQRYITNPKIFHCPWDKESDQLYSDGTHSVYNMRFMSYQVVDNGCSNPDPESGSACYADGKTQYTYNPVRESPVDYKIDIQWQRQLLHFFRSPTGAPKGPEMRPPTDDTIVFWCPFHRGRSDNGRDNVLFWDGSVQSIPVHQDIDGTVYEGWLRFPEK